MRQPKYSQTEFERRFLVRDAPDLSEASCRIIDDLYIEQTRLRLRAITAAADGQVEYKLCKKYPSTARDARPIVNIYLSEAEYDLLTRLPGRRLRKRRYRLSWHGRPYGVDVFEGELAGLVLCEVEASSVDELEAIATPAWCEMEVTRDPFFDGDRLAQLTATQLHERLRT